MSTATAARERPILFSGPMVRAILDGTKTQTRRPVMIDRRGAEGHWHAVTRSVSDLFHDDVPDKYIERVFAVMALADRHTFQVLTKRPRRMVDFFADEWRWAMIEGAAQSIWHERTGEDPSMWLAVHGPLPNVWLGVSVENQRWADERIPLLMATSAAVRFLSCEPLLGHLELDFDDIAWRDAEGRYLDWVIVGGESGADARPCDVFDITDVVAQCELSGVACFVKQLGARPVIANDSDAGLWPGASIPFAEQYEPHHQGELGPIKLRDRHGADMAEWPAELRVREFPASGVRA